MKWWIKFTIWIAADGAIGRVKDAISQSSFRNSIVDIDEQTTLNKFEWEVYLPLLTSQLQ